MRSNYLVNDSTGKDALTQAILELIEKSRSNIKIANFFFQYKEVIDAISRALDRGVAVFVLSNIKQNQNGEKSTKDGLQNDTTLFNLTELRYSGAHIGLLNDLHAKFLIADSKEAIVGSANFKEASLKYKSESGLRIIGEDIRALEYVFETLYCSADKSVFLSSGRHALITQTSVTSINKAMLENSRMRFTIVASNSYRNADYHSNLPKDKEAGVISIFQSILKVVETAEEYIYIVNWHFKALEDLPELFDALKQANRRGVQIALVSSVGEANALNQKAVDKLIKIGCKHYGHKNNHAKFAVNEHSGLLFSANIDGKSGLLTGFEVGCMLSQGERSEAVRHFLNLVGECEQIKDRQ